MLFTEKKKRLPINAHGYNAPAMAADVAQQSAENAPHDTTGACGSSCS